MSDVIGKIAGLLGIGREDSKKLERKKRKPGRVRLENDSITISSEARRLSAGNLDDEFDEDYTKLK